MPPDVEYGEDPEGFVRNQDSLIRVLVADDHPLMLEGLCTVIQAQPDMQVSFPCVAVCVGTVANGANVNTATMLNRLVEYHDCPIRMRKEDL